MDKHLNLFSFFNAQNLEYYEDNLSRAFALCLKYDTLFLDNVLRTVLDENIYFNLFNTDYPDYHIEIDLQKRPSDLENFSQLIAVACSAHEIDVLAIERIVARETDSPITDICIVINDTCVIFEFKRTSEDCSAQLKCQVEKIKENCDETVTITYVDLNWRKIVKTLLGVLSLQRQINSQNAFTNDFVNYLERQHPEWFPQRLLKNISSPKDSHEPNSYYISSRLNQIKIQLAKLLNGDVGEISGKYSRFIVTINWGWAKEIHVDHIQLEGKSYITAKIFPGDTKAQGGHLYKPGKSAIIFPRKIRGFELETNAYLKFSHFNSGIFWFHPNLQEYYKTHNREFHDSYAGRYKKKHWNDFEKDMDVVAPEWKQRCAYKEYITDSNRSYFDLSMGMVLTAYIPYKEAQKLDQNESSNLSVELCKITLEIKSIIDGN